MRLLRTPENPSSINSSNTREAPESHTTSDNSPHQDSSIWSSLLNNSWSSHLNSPWSKAVTLITVAGFPTEEACHERFELVPGECSNCLHQDRKKILERNSDKCVHSESFSSKTSSTPISTDSRRQISTQKLVNPAVDSGGSSESLVWKLVNKVDSEEDADVSTLATDGKSSLSEFEKRRILEHFSSKFGSEYLEQAANLLRKCNRDHMKKPPTLSESEITTLDYDTPSRSDTRRIGNCYKNVWQKTNHSEKASKEYICANKKINNVNSDPSEIFDIQLTVKNNSSDSFSNCVVNIRKTGNAQKSNTALEQELSDKNICQANSKLKTAALEGKVYSYEQCTNTNNTTSEECNVCFYNSKKSNESDACHQEQALRESSRSSTDLELSRICPTCRTEQQLRQLLALLNNITLSEKDLSSILSSDKIKNYKNSKPSNNNYNHDSYNADSSIEKFPKSESASNSEGEASNLKNCFEPHILKSLQGRLDAEKQIHAANSYCIDLIKYIQNKLDELEQIMFAAKLLENASKNVNLNKQYKSDHEKNRKVAYRNKNVRLLDKSHTASLRNNDICERQHDDENLLRQMYQLYSVGNVETNFRLENSNERVSNEQADQTCCREDCTVGKVVRDLQHRISELEHRLNLKPDIDTGSSSTRKQDIDTGSNSTPKQDFVKDEYEESKLANEESKGELSVQVPESTTSHRISAPEVADFDVGSTEPPPKNIADMGESTKYEAEDMLHKDKSLEHFKSCTDIGVKDDVDKNIDGVNQEREVPVEPVNIGEIPRDKSVERVELSRHSISSVKDDGVTLKKSSLVSYSSKNRLDEILTDVLEETESSTSFDKEPHGLTETKVHKCLADCNPENLPDKTQQCEKPCPLDLCDKNRVASQCNKISKHSSLELKKAHIIRSDVIYEKDSKNYSNADVKNECPENATICSDLTDERTGKSVQNRAGSLTSVIEEQSMEESISIKDKSSLHKKSSATLKELPIKTHEYIKPIASVENDLTDSELATDNEHECRAACHPKDMKDSVDASSRPCPYLCSTKRTTIAVKPRTDQYQTINKYISLENIEHRSPIQSTEENSQSLRNMPTLSLNDKSASRKSINKSSIGDIAQVKRSSIDQSSNNKEATLELDANLKRESSSLFKGSVMSMKNGSEMQNIEHRSPIQSREENSQSLRNMPTLSLNDKSASRKSINKSSIGDISQVKRSPINQPGGNDEATLELDANLKRESSSLYRGSVMSMKNSFDVLKKPSPGGYASKESLYKIPDYVQSITEPLSSFHEVEQRNSTTTSLKSASLRSESVIPSASRKGSRVSQFGPIADTVQTKLKSTQEKACVTDCGSNCATMQKTRCRCCGCTNVIKIENVNDGNIDNSICISSSEKNIKDIDLTTPSRTRTLDDVSAPHGVEFYGKDSHGDVLGGIPENTEISSEKEIANLDFTRSASKESQKLIKNKSDVILEKTLESLPELDIEPQKSTTSRSTIESLRNLYEKRSSIDRSIKGLEDIIENGLNQSSQESKLNVSKATNETAKPEEPSKMEFEPNANHQSSAISLNEQSSSLNRSTVSNLKDLFRKRSSIDRSITDLESQIEKELDKLTDADEGITAELSAEHPRDSIKSLKDSQTRSSLRELNEKLSPANPFSADFHEVIAAKKDRSPDTSSNKLEVKEECSCPDLLQSEICSTEQTPTDFAKSTENVMEETPKFSQVTMPELNMEQRKSSAASPKGKRSPSRISLTEISKKRSSIHGSTKDLAKVIENELEDSNKITSPEQTSSVELKNISPVRMGDGHNSHQSFSYLEKEITTFDLDLPEEPLEPHKDKLSQVNIEFRGSTTSLKDTDDTPQVTVRKTSSSQTASIFPTIAVSDNSTITKPDKRTSFKDDNVGRYYLSKIHSWESNNMLLCDCANVVIEDTTSKDTAKAHDTISNSVSAKQSYGTPDSAPTTNLLEVPKFKTDDIISSSASAKQSRATRDSETSTNLLGVVKSKTDDIISTNDTDKQSHATRDSATNTNLLGVAESKADDIISSNASAKQSHGTLDSATNTNLVGVPKSKEDIISTKQSHGTLDSATNTNLVGAPKSKEDIISAKQSHGTLDSATNTDLIGVPKSEEDIILNNASAKQSHGTLDSATNTNLVGLPKSEEDVISNNTSAKQSHGTRDSATNTNLVEVPKSEGDIISNNVSAKQSRGTLDSATNTNLVGVPESEEDIISTSASAKQSHGTRDSATSTNLLEELKSKRDDLLSNNTSSKQSHDKRDSATSTNALEVIAKDLNASQKSIQVGTETLNNRMVPQEPTDFREHSLTDDKASPIKLGDNIIVPEESRSLLHRTIGSFTSSIKGDNGAIVSSDRISTTKLNDLLIPEEQSHLITISTESIEMKPGTSNTGLPNNNEIPEICPAASEDQKQACCCDEIIKSMQSKIEALEKFNNEALIKDLLNKMNSLEQTYFAKKDNPSKAPHEELGLFYLTETHEKPPDVPKGMFFHEDAGDFDENDLKEEIASNSSIKSNAEPSTTKSIQTAKEVLKNKEIQSDACFYPRHHHTIRAVSSDEEQLKILKLFMHSHLCSDCRSEVKNVSGKLHIPRASQTITVEQEDGKKRPKCVKCLLVNEHKLTYCRKRPVGKDKLVPYQEKPLTINPVQIEANDNSTSKLSLLRKENSSEEKKCENQKPKRKNHWFLVLCKLCCYK